MIEVLLDREEGMVFALYALPLPSYLLLRKFEWRKGNNTQGDCFPFPMKSELCFRLANNCMPTQSANRRRIFFALVFPSGREPFFLKTHTKDAYTQKRHYFRYWWSMSWSPHYRCVKAVEIVKMWMHIGDFNPHFLALALCRVKKQSKAKQSKANFDRGSALNLTRMHATT